ncbi:MAG: UDP-glucose--hexose-1-phosphate uridylyltransferase [Treponema sp.]|jgi:UDPglucose--hexose-1-phosphate uridylyltransferase|nr:UDP-glucose--hexose-1-phosphate uridylyltransferase [Treponema sp.]
MTILQNINRLVSYALETKLIEPDDRIYIQNCLLDLFELDGFEDYTQAAALPHGEKNNLEEILAEMLAYAEEKKLADLSSTADRDIFDTRIMAILVPPPSVVRAKFRELYRAAPEKATGWYYDFSQNTNYIRRYRVSKDIKWKTPSEYGDIDITINLSKPEKDPKKIAAARFAKQGGYPACLLCKENEGYDGRSNRVARQNHRIIPVTLGGEQWGLQYSPYVYFNEHCIVFNFEHRPMKICRNTFRYLFDFVRQFPQYILGSNADLPIVGGSILTHDHYQGGRYVFPLARAALDREFTVPGFGDVKTGIVKWPMSVIRLTGKDSDRLTELSTRILEAWRKYTDEKAFIFAETDGEKHNTITPIARRRGEDYEIDLVLRNNITTKEHPLGVFHPHAELHHIKKENIGLIEVMGLAILPARLKTELEQAETAVLTQQDLRADEMTAKHADWIESFIPRYKNISKETIGAIFKTETGNVFKRVLEDAGVYKNTDAGRAAFDRFTAVLGK